MLTKHGRHGQVVTLWKWLTFGVALDLHVDHFSIFHRCGIQHFRRYLPISHIVLWFYGPPLQRRVVLQWFHSLRQ